MPYAVPNIAVAVHPVKAPVPVLWWRSVGHTHTAQVVEVMIDELAHAAGKDPVAFRLALLAKQPRHAGVLKLAAEKGGLEQGHGEGHGHRHRGARILPHLRRRGRRGLGRRRRHLQGREGRLRRRLRHRRQPEIIVAQMEGGIGYALGAALRNKITLSQGAVEQSNFNDYEPLRIDDMPKVEVHIVASSAAPTGVGEPGVPALAPAVSNAVFAATGKRLRSLPFADTQLKGA